MDYVVKIEGFILGDWRDVGADVRLTDTQALPFLREGRIEPKPAKFQKPKDDKAA